MKTLVPSSITQATTLAPPSGYSLTSEHLLAPVAMCDLVYDWDKDMRYRVMIKANDGPDNDQYAIYVGDRHVRYFHANDMPVEVKANLAMVKAFKTDKIPPVPIPVPPIQALNAYPPEFVDIGWKLGQDWYCIVMDENVLCKLRGETDDDQRGPCENKNTQGSG